jgi:hypothetical protein
MLESYLVTLRAERTGLTIDFSAQPLLVETLLLASDSRQTKTGARVLERVRILLGTAPNQSQPETVSS